MNQILDIRQFLQGDVMASGVVKDWRGAVSRRFVAKLHGNFTATGGTLKEWFTYDDGEADQREWKVVMSGDNRFTATAHDVVGESKGLQEGFTVRMRYVLALKLKKGKTVNVSMDDRLYLVDETTVINTIRMKKFGIPVGQVVVAFNRS